MANLLETDELAALFRVTPQTIHTWRRVGMPAAEEGGKGAGNSAQYRLLDVVTWYFRERYEALELDRQRTRLAAEQADRLAQENALKRGEIGELDVWQRELERLFGDLRSALLALPTKLAPRLDGDVNQRRDRLEQAIHEALRGLVDYQPSRSAARDAREDSGLADGSSATAETDGERVGRRQSAAFERKQRRARKVEH